MGIHVQRDTAHFCRWCKIWVRLETLAIPGVHICLLKSRSVQCIHARTHLSSMALTRAQNASVACQHAQQAALQHRRRQFATICLLAGAVTSLAISIPRLFPRPQHMSILTGHMWMEELLRGHPDTFYDMMGMRKHVFQRLYWTLCRFCELHDSRWITALEMLGIFCYTAKTGLISRMVKHRFQVSGDTVTWCILW